MDAQMLWCGSVRCYFLPRLKGPNVAFVAGGIGDSARVHVSLKRYGREPDDMHELCAMFTSALSELLDQPKGFPLHGIHWIPPSAGGSGAVLEDGVPKRLPQGGERIRMDLRHLRDEFGWEL
jgi:hypothetical protein